MDLNQKHASRLLPILAGQMSELLVINMTLIGAYVAYSMILWIWEAFWILMAFMSCTSK
jgi:hypothetical protein